ncbi:MAG: insulinase family protein [Candidatus Eisenbacteria bacterium]|nr:insulinase family protein [Candidatus Eisenbacteria bacterium]
MKRVLTALLCAVVVLGFAGSPGAQTLEDKVSEFELDNGMKFLVVERHEAPVVFCAVAFRVGSIYERPGITGISHLLEHMLFKGTATVGTKDFEAEQAYLEREDELAETIRSLRLEMEPWRYQIFEEDATSVIANLSEADREAVGNDRALELELLVERLTERGPTGAMLDVPGLVEEGNTDYYGLYIELLTNEMMLQDVMAEHRELIVSNELWETYMNNGARMLNAGTSYDGTFYFAYLPANRLELFMLLESDRLANAVFREFYTERDVVAEERRMSENEPESMLFESFMATAYSACMYRSPVLGWMSDIQMTTRQDLQDYYDRYYAPNNALGIFIGDVTPEQVQEFAEEYFAPIPAGEELPPLVTCEPEQQGERRVVVKKDAKPVLMMGYHVPQIPHPDAYVMEMISGILSQGRTSRFHTSIYEEQGLTRSAPSAWIGPGSRLAPLFVINAEPKAPHTLEEVEAAVYAELERLKTEEVEMRELERLWNAEEAMLVRALGSNMGMAFRVGMYEAMRGDWRAIYTDMERKKAVTPADIMRVAKKYFTEENRTVGWLVEVESDEPDSGEEELDLRKLMQWAQTLPEEEQREMMMKFQSLDEQGRAEFAKELWERMKAEQG